MVFDHNGFAGYPHSLVKQPHGILGVMQHIYKHHGIKGRIAMGNRLAVECFDRDMGLPSDDDVDASQIDVGTLLLDEMGD
jgi:hypothetical protein